MAEGGTLPTIYPPSKSRAVNSTQRETHAIYTFHMLSCHTSIFSRREKSRSEEDTDTDRLDRAGYF